LNYFSSFSPHSSSNPITLLLLHLPRFHLSIHIHNFIKFIQSKKIKIHKNYKPIKKIFIQPKLPNFFFQKSAAKTGWNKEERKNLETCTFALSFLLLTKPLLWGLTATTNTTNHRHNAKIVREEKEERRMVSEEGNERKKKEWWDLEKRMNNSEERREKRMRFTGKEEKEKELGFLIYNQGYFRHFTFWHTFKNKK